MRVSVSVCVFVCVLVYVGQEVPSDTGRHEKDGLTSDDRQEDCNASLGVSLPREEPPFDTNQLDFHMLQRLDL